MFTFRSEITVVPGKMPEMVEAWQQFIKGSKFPCRLYAAVTGRFNVVAVEADMEHLSDLEPWAATWPNPSPDIDPTFAKYLSVEVNGGGGALWLKLA